MATTQRMGENERTDGREERSDRTVQMLIQSARSAFASVGFAAASVRDIAGDAGVNPALVRYHFGSKDGLYRRVLGETMSQLSDRLRAAFRPDGSPRERITRAIAAYLDHLAEHRDTPRLIQRALLDADPTVREIVNAHHRPLLQALEPFQAGELVTLHVSAIEEAVTSLFGAIVAPFLYAPVLTELFGHDVLSPEAMDRRRQHISALVEFTLDQLLPSELGHA